jgi:hypothetical protein
MNAYIESQTSGNQWVPHIYPMLHEEIRPSPLNVSGATLDAPGLGQLSPFFDQLERQMARYVAEHDRILQEIRRQFVIPADSAVTEFLTEHRSIAPILLEAQPYLKTYFGADTVFNLRAPIDESGSCTLYAVAMWPGEACRARDALQRFDDAWWLRRASETHGLLTFTYELI